VQPPADHQSPPQPVTIRLPGVAAGYVNVFRAARVSVSYGGDQDGASADLDQAVRLDPKLLIAYAERGIPFYPVVKSDHVFGDLTPVTHAERPGHARVALTASSKQSAEAEVLPNVVPLPRPRNPRLRNRPQIFAQPGAWYASVFQ